jgi:hypothetical protein
MTIGQRRRGNVGDAQLLVFTAMHGMGDWVPVPVAESLEMLLKEQAS